MLLLGIMLRATIWVAPAFCPARRRQQFIILMFHIFFAGVFQIPDAVFLAFGTARALENPLI